ncbi:MAG: HNH endonuclease [Candidatus Cloacimonetes bacterium]|nr:HNH endonuclease [Candidatus Cloacimonadota bacterium]
MKKICIICKNLKDENEFNEEHIFPESIGNKELKIYRVCKECNEKRLSKIDASLTNHKLIETRRLMYKIPGKKGIIPNPFENGVLESDPEQKVKLSFDNQNRVKIYNIPKISKPIQNKENKRIDITIDNKDKNNLQDIINKKLNRMGASELYREEEQIIEKHPNTIHNLTIDNKQYKKAIIKIAYELGFYFLGEKYLKDRVGEFLRLFLMDDLNEWSNCDLGHIDFIDKEDNRLYITLVNLLKIKKYEHLAFIFIVDQKIHIIIRIFDLIDALIIISKEPDLYRIPEKDLIIIDSRSGEVEKYKFSQKVTNKNKATI